MSEKSNTLRIRVKRLLVAIMSVFLILTLMTTISFTLPPAVFAAGEEEAAAETTENTEAEGSGEAAEAAPAQGDEAAAPESDAANTGNDAAADKAAASDKAAAGNEIDEELEDDTSSDPLDTGLRRQTTVPEVSADAYIVMSGSTSEVISEKHSDRKLSPGKITMLMTAMVVIDNMYNDSELKNTVGITEDFESIGRSFKAGDTVTVGDLLSAMLVGGSGQAAEALASYSASSREIFIKEMNSKAMELGLMDTQFNNPAGFYSTQNYSTAHDCAVIAQTAQRYQLIKDAFNKRSVTVSVANPDGDRKVNFNSTNPLLVGKKPSELYNLIRGGIQSYLPDPVDATQYAGIATSDDMQLIVVMLDADEDTIAHEAKALLEYGDLKVTRSVIVKAGKRVGRARVRGGSRVFVNAYTETKGFAYVPPEGSPDLVTTEVVMYDDLTAPLSEGAKVGEFRIYVADELKGTVDLITKKNIPKGWWPSRYYISNLVTIIIGIILLLILLLVLRILYVRKRRARIRAERRQRRISELAMQQLAAEEDRRRRNWENRTTPVYADTKNLRTSDLREQARKETRREELIAEAAKTGVSARTIMKKAARDEKKKEAAREKANKTIQ